MPDSVLFQLLGYLNGGMAIEVATLAYVELARICRFLQLMVSAISGGGGNFTPCCSHVLPTFFFKSHAFLSRVPCSYTGAT
jgi:F0F1-type ATP synthase assembly protein I